MWLATIWSGYACKESVARNFLIKAAPHRYAFNIPYVMRAIDCKRATDHVLERHSHFHSKYPPSIILDSFPGIYKQYLLIVKIENRPSLDAIVKRRRTSFSAILICT